MSHLLRARSLTTPLRVIAHFTLALVLASGCAFSAPGRPTWTSAVTGQALALMVHEPTPATDKTAPRALPTVLYLLNLAAPRVGTESDDIIVRDLLAQGCRVVTVDFGLNP